MSARSLLAAATVVLVSLLCVPAAHATLLDLASCPNPSVEYPFTRWLDPAAYVPVPDGGLEAKARGWSLGSTAVDPGNESYYVSSATDKRLLTVPAGASATTAATCVSADRPTVRFFARRASGGALSALRVDVLFTGPLGTVAEAPVGVVGGGSSWAPTLPMTVLANLAGTLDGAAPAAFRFTASGGTWQLDDVYVDPYVRH